VSLSFTTETLSSFSVYAVLENCVQPWSFKQSPKILVFIFQMRTYINRMLTSFLSSRIFVLMV